VTRLSSRSDQRARERGATLFVVVLAITMLTGVGLYTVHAASLSARAAGNGREALQAERVAELNGLALLSQLRIDAVPYVKNAINADPQLSCEMNPGLPPRTSCLQLTSDGLIPPSGASLIGSDSFGPLATLSGKARMEITDVNTPKLMIAGQDGNGIKMVFYQATVTTVGYLNPAGVGASACVNGMMQASGQHMLRAHLLLGPMQEFQPPPP
jgi:hypothetical protein